MFFLTPREYQNIINEYDNKLIEILHEYLVHQVHEVRWSVGQDKRHHSELIPPISICECCFWYILNSDFQLMVT
jgi:hypothetical protein